MKKEFYVEAERDILSKLVRRVVVLIMRKNEVWSLYRPRLSLLHT